MSQEIEMPSLAQTSEALSWFQVWTRAITRPSVATFEEITRDPKATSKRAFVWIFTAYLLGYGLSLLIQTVTHRTSLSESMLGLVFALPLGGVVCVIFTTFIVLIADLIARALGGTGTFSKLVHAFAASLAPITLIVAVSSSIPMIQFVAYPLGLYEFALNILAVKAVHQFGWVKAIASNLHTVALAVAVLVAFVVSGYLATYLLSNMNALYDKDYAALTDALAKRWDDDASIPTASTGFDADSANGKFTDIWLVIELSYTGTCSSAPSNPCSHLANELVRIVFNNYRKVHELTGIRVVIGKKPHYLRVESSDIMLDKSLTVEGWEKELSIQK